MEPRAIPAATRGPKPCPYFSGGTTKPDSKTGTEHHSGNTPEHHKHLKSLVLTPDPASKGLGAVVFVTAALRARGQPFTGTTSGHPASPGVPRQVPDPNPDRRLDMSMVVMGLSLEPLAGGEIGLFEGIMSRAGPCMNGVGVVWRAVAAGISVIVAAASGVVTALVTTHPSRGLWVALGVAVILGAVLQAALTFGDGKKPPGTQASGTGAVAVGGSAQEDISTHVDGSHGPAATPSGRDGVSASGPGSVSIGGNAAGRISTDVTGDEEPNKQ